MNPELIKTLVYLSLFVFAVFCVYGLLRFIKAWKGYKASGGDIDPAALKNISLPDSMPALTAEQKAALEARRLIERAKQLDLDEKIAPLVREADLSHDALQFANAKPRTQAPPETPAEARAKKEQEYKNDAERQLFSD